MDKISNHLVIIGCLLLVGSWSESYSSVGSIVNSCNLEACLVWDAVLLFGNSGVGPFVMKLVGLPALPTQPKMSHRAVVGQSAIARRKKARQIYLLVKS